MEERVGGVVQRSYSYGLDLLSQRRLVGSGYVMSYYSYDGHGSVRALTAKQNADDGRPVTDTYTYDAFGNLLERTGSTPNLYLYAGEQFDPELGLYYNRARYLDVTQGRFWGMDSFEGTTTDPRSLHKYLYTANNPIDRVDPSGREFNLASTVATSAFVGSLSGGIIGGITGGLRGAINGAVQGAVFGAVFPLGGAGIGTALLGNAARGVFLVGVGGLIGSTGVSGYSLATATSSEERNAALLNLGFTAAFAYFGPRVLQSASTRSVPAEEINMPFISQGKKAPYTPGSFVTETTIFRPVSYVRVYTEGRTQPVGVWLAEPTEVIGLTPAQIQSRFSLPFTPTHIETVNLPAGTSFRMGTANGDAFGGTGGGLQIELLQRLPANNYGPGAPLQ